MICALWVVHEYFYACILIFMLFLLFRYFLFLLLLVMFLLCFVFHIFGFFFLFFIAATGISQHDGEDLRNWNEFYGISLQRPTHWRLQTEGSAEEGSRSRLHSRYRGISRDRWRQERSESPGKTSGSDTNPSQALNHSQNKVANAAQTRQGRPWSI